MSELEDKISGILGDPAQMEKITKLAQSLMGGESAGPPGGKDAPQPPPPGVDAAGGFDLDSLGIDAGTIARISRLMQSGSAQNKEEQALLAAMRPYLSEKRRRKMDRAMKLAQLARLARLAMGETEEDGSA